MLTVSQQHVTALIARSFAHIAMHPDQHVHLKVMTEEDALRLAEVMKETIDRVHIELVSSEGGPNPAVRMGGVVKDQKLLVPIDHEQVMHPKGVDASKPDPKPQIIVPKGVPSGEEVGGV